MNKIDASANVDGKAPDAAEGVAIHDARLMVNATEIPDNASVIEDGTEDSALYPDADIEPIVTEEEFANRIRKRPSSGT